MKTPIAVIGAGKVGSALALLLKQAGYPVVGIASRSLSSAKKLADMVKTVGVTDPSMITKDAELLFITTPDREIEKVAASLVEKDALRAGQIVIHTSGATSSNVMSPVRTKGAFAVSMHPLQSFADVNAALANLPGSYFALEGDKKGLAAAEQVVSDLGGISFAIKPEDKPVYHAAACIACNYLVALMHLSTTLFAKLGVSREDTFKALKPLVDGTIKNISLVGPVKGLTGPIARGDEPTIQGHLQALDRMDPELAKVYRTLGAYTVKIAKESGSITTQQEKGLLKLFKGVNDIV